MRFGHVLLTIAAHAGFIHAEGCHRRPSHRRVSHSLRRRPHLRHSRRAHLSSIRRPVRARAARSSFIGTRHEQGAAYMAFGYAKSTGKIGVYTCVPGPGVLNTDRRAVHGLLGERAGAVPDERNSGGGDRPRLRHSARAAGPARALARPDQVGASASIIRARCRASVRSCDGAADDAAASGRWRSNAPGIR